MMYSSFFVVLFTVAFVDLYLAKKLKINSVLGFGISIVLSAIIIFPLNFYFEVPIFTLSYGVVPNIDEEDVGGFTALYVGFLGLFIIVVERAYALLSRFLERRSSSRDDS